MCCAGSTDAKVSGTSDGLFRDDIMREDGTFENHIHVKRKHISMEQYDQTSISAAITSIRSRVCSRRRPTACHRSLPSLESMKSQFGLSKLNHLIYLRQHARRTHLTLKEADVTPQSSIIAMTPAVDVAESERIRVSRGCDTSKSCV